MGTLYIELFSMSHLTKLLQNPQLWRSGRRNKAFGQLAISSGHSALDSALHGCGWPRAGSSELLCEHSGIGELSLLMPALAELSQQQFIAWLNPPFQPYAPALQQAGVRLEHCLFVHTNNLRDQLWAAEELLRAGTFAALINWSSSANLTDRDLRRLHLAAKENGCWHAHFRAWQLSRQSSPAPLRLLLNSTATQLQIQLLKQAGGPAGQRVVITRDRFLLHEQKPVTAWPQPTPTPQPRHRKNRLLLAHPFKPASPRQGVELH